MSENTSARGSIFRVTANLPEKLRGPIRHQVRNEHYPSDSAYGVGLILWDVYSKQPHLLTGPLMREPQWVIDRFVDEVAEEWNVPALETNLRTFRLTVNIPCALEPLVRFRMKEERYRSRSAYLTALVLFDLKVRTEKKVPHHKTSPLMREPDWVRDQVLHHLVAEFGNPDRKWPKGICGRIEELIHENKAKPDESSPSRENRP